LGQGHFWISRHGASKTQTDEQNFAEFAEGPRMGWFSDFDLYTRAGIPIVDHIVSYENLNAELAKVTTLIGLPDLNIGQIKVNSAQRPKSGRDLTRFYGADFDNSASRRVREVFAQEIEYFGYTPPTA